MQRRDRLRLAAEAELDPRTVDRAESEGVRSLRSEVDRDRLRRAAQRLRVTLPEDKPGS